MAPRAKPAQKEQDENNDVDEHSEDVELLTGQIDEIDLEASRRIAKRMGWTPKEEWGGNPEKWDDAPEFLENAPRVIERLKGAADRAAKAAAAVIEDERRRGREEAERRVREAEDPEERVQAAKELAKHSGDPPETVAWKMRNPWYETDSLAQAVAKAAADHAVKSGRTTFAEQLEEAEAAVRKRFPEHFTTGGEVRLSEVRRTPPAVQSGTRAVTSVSKEKGFADLPRAAREAFDTHFRKKGSDPERYAKAYWRGQEKAE